MASQVMLFLVCILKNPKFLTIKLLPLLLPGGMIIDESIISPVIEIIRRVSDCLIEQESTWIR